MTTATQHTPIKRTKKLAKLFQQYEVVVRDQPTVITHAVSNRPITIEPVAFAVYELGIKAIYANNLACGEEMRKMFFESHYDKHYAKLAERGDFELLEPFKTHQAHAEDYSYACALLGKAN